MKFLGVYSFVYFYRHYRQICTYKYIRTYAVAYNPGFNNHIGNEFRKYWYLLSSLNVLIKRVYFVLLDQFY